MQVPLYDTFGAEAVEFIIKHSNIAIIFCSSSKLAALAEVLPKVKDQVVQVVVWSSLPGVPVSEDIVDVCSSYYHYLLLVHLYFLELWVSMYLDGKAKNSRSRKCTRETVL